MRRWKVARYPRWWCADHSHAPSHLSHGRPSAESAVARRARDIATAPPSHARDTGAVRAARSPWTPHRRSDSDASC
eukprot:227243-Chlamydomonas_euryale.AAC.16